MDQMVRMLCPGSNPCYLCCTGLAVRISTAEVVKIQSADLNGRFLVVKGKHKGGRTGDWKTTMELKPFTPPASPTGGGSSSSGGSNGGGGGSYVIGDIVNFIGSRHYVSSTESPIWEACSRNSHFAIPSTEAAHLQSS